MHWGSRCLFIHVAPITLSHWHIVTLSHYHIAHFHIITLHISTLPHCHNFHIITSSHCHIVTFSHALMLSRSHAPLLTRSLAHLLTLLLCSLAPLLLKIKSYIFPVILAFILYPLRIDQTFIDGSLHITCKTCNCKYPAT